MFTNEERERIMREARETLARRYEPAPPPVEQANRTRLPPIEFEDPLRRWQREADVAARERESADAERKRQEREDERRRGANWWAAVDAHIERRLAEQRDSVSELARGTVEFANAVQDRLLAMEKLPKHQAHRVARDR